MRVVIFHYHLNPGGVTRIIELQIKSLLKRNPLTKIVLLTGSEANNQQDFKGAQIIVNPLFNYLIDNDETLGRLNEIYTSLLSLMKEIVNKEDIIHCHNIILGKNPLITLLFFQLALENYKILSHCHDFPEERPENMTFLKKVINEYFKKPLHHILYPDLPDYKYAVLNTHDTGKFRNTGINVKNIFFLPNAVSIESTNIEENTSKEYILEKLSIKDDKKIITYPVRAISRKNIGEFILLAVLFSDEANFIVTQPPKNPKEIPDYLDWKEFCRINSINIIFEAGTLVNHIDLISVSDFCVTTSIREGFGMVYLEPWLLNTPVAGRNLKNITVDFEKEGINTGNLYESLNISYKKSVIDFKDLNFSEQKEFINLIKTDKDLRKKIFTLNPVLADVFKPVNNIVIKKNQEIIKEKYSLEKYGEKLEGIYYQFT